jgi:hypothetical protein
MTATGREKSSRRSAFRTICCGVAEISVQIAARALRAAGEQGACVRHHHRIVVGVDDPRLGRDRLGYFVRVVSRGKAGADVEELPDARLARQVADRAGQERPVGAHGQGQVRVRLQRPVTGLPVGGEMVLAAQPVVIDPGDMRDAGVEDGRFRGRFLARRVEPLLLACHAAPFVQRKLPGARCSVGRQHQAG